MVQGRVLPDLFHVHKPTLKLGFRPLVRKVLGTKEIRLEYDDGHRQVKSVRVPDEQRARWSLTDDEVLTLARWAALIEDHYSRTRRRHADGHRVGQGRRLRRCDRTHR